MRSSDKKGLLSVLLVGLVNGLIFIALLPAWQHYDEPAHFEYAWLLAARSRLPEAADFDPAMRQAVARSMIEAGFFKRLTFAPDLDDPTGKVWIAPVTQLEDPPLYYLLAAAAMKPLDRQAILAQLYAGRLVSLGLFLLTLAIAWGVAAELTPPGSALRWMLPLSMALLPGFVDVMTSLNNSVGAVAFFSLFLWEATRLVRRGFAWTTFLWTCAAALACLGMQASAFLAAPLLLVALLFSALRGPRRKLAWIVSGAAGLLLLLAIFTWGDAALWFRQGPQPEATRARSQAAPLGKYAFAVHLEPGAAPAELAQLVPLAAGGRLREQAFTLGAWMWTDRPGLYRTPRLATNLGKREYGESVWLDATPRFHAFTGITGKNTLRSWVLLAPASQAATPGSSRTATVYYDGVTLAEGIFSTDEAPSYAGSEASSGEWGERAVHKPGAQRVRGERLAASESAGRANWRQAAASFRARAGLYGILQPRRPGGSRLVLPEQPGDARPHLLGQVRLGAGAPGRAETLPLAGHPDDRRAGRRGRLDVAAAQADPLGYRAALRAGDSRCLGTGFTARIELPYPAHQLPGSSSLCIPDDHPLHADPWRGMEGNPGRDPQVAAGRACLDLLPVPGIFRRVRSLRDLEHLALLLRDVRPKATTCDVKYKSPRFNLS